MDLQMLLAVWVGLVFGHSWGFAVIGNLWHSQAGYRCTVPQCVGGSTEMKTTLQSFILAAADSHHIGTVVQAISALVLANRQFRFHTLWEFRDQRARGGHMMA
jgi:hypothetical protein